MNSLLSILFTDQWKPVLEHGATHRDGQIQPSVKSISLDEPGPPWHKRTMSSTVSIRQLSCSDLMMIDEEGVLLGRAFLEMADARASLGDWKKAMELWEKVLQNQKGTNRVTVAETLSRRGKHLTSMGMYYEAVLDLEKAAHIKTELLKLNPSRKLTLDLADTLLQLGHAQRLMNHYVESLRSLDAALSIRKQVLGDFDLKVAEVHCLIATTYHQRRSYSEARHFYRKALVAFRKSGIRSDDPTFQQVRRGAADRNIIGHAFWQGGLSYSI